MKTRSYVEECDEWQAIKHELLAASGDKSVTAFDVTQEQERRMAARGERMLTLEEAIASAQATLDAQKLAAGAEAR